MIYILYGQPGAGKTTLGSMLATQLETPFFIDGDEFREMFANKNYDKEGRQENIKNANAIASYLNKKGKIDDWVCIYVRDKKNLNSLGGISVNSETDVVLSLVNPYQNLREELKQANSGEVVEILLQSSRDLRKDYHVKDFEEGEPHYIIDTDKEVIDSWAELKGLLKL